VSIKCSFSVTRMWAFDSKLRRGARNPRTPAVRMTSERQSDLALEIPLDRSGLAENCRAFARDYAEGRGAANCESGSHELRMIQDVRGVQSNRQLLGLGKTERLRQVPIEIENTGAVQRTVPEGSDLSRSWIHQYIDRRSGRCVGQCVQRTEIGQ